MSDAIHISELINLLRKQMKVLVAVPILAIVAGVMLTALSPTEYSALAEVALVDGITISSDHQNAQLSVDRARNIQNEITLAQSDNVVAVAEAALGSDEHELIVVPKPNADALFFAAKDSSAEGAAEIANAYANAYIQVRQAAQAKAFEETLSVLDFQIGEVDTSLEQSGLSATAIESLVDRRTELTAQVIAVELAQQTGADGVAQLNRAAEPPEDPSSASLGKNLALALALGIVLALGVALVLIALDTEETAPMSS